MVQNKSGLLIISLFVGVILAILFIQILADITADTGIVRVTNNQSLTGPSVLLGNQVLRDANNIQGTTVNLNNFTNNTIGTNNYLAYTNGSVILKAGMLETKAQGANPTLNYSYSYYSEMYVKDSTSRTFLNLIVLFFAVGLLIYLVVYLKNNTGLFDSF
jgi:hypothetical protein